MNIYERFGIRAIVNVAGTGTRYGGGLVRQEAIDAMREAAREAVSLIDLHAAASSVIAGRTHAEAGIVTAGATAALTLGTAACITGLDVAKMNRLPDTTGMPNEVIVPYHEFSGYDILGYAHAISAAGAKIVKVDIPWPHSWRTISKWDVEAAITEKTIAIAYDIRAGGHPSLEEVVEIGKKHSIPILVDAAGAVPPPENLYKFIDAGADLVAFSGGKGIRGPQNSGILCGRRDLVASALLQMIDMAGKAFDEWNPPSLIPKEKLKGKPKHGIGRGMKVSKEAIVGLLVALEKLTEEDWGREGKQLRGLLERIKMRLQGIRGIELTLRENVKEGFPTLDIKVNSSELGKTATEISLKLRTGQPSIYVWDLGKNDLLVINPVNLNEEATGVVSEALYNALTG